MAKRFRLRVSRAISTTLQSCRSKDPSMLPEDPVPSFSTLKINGRRSFFIPRASSAFPSFGTALALPSGGVEPPEFKWREEEKWHVVARIYENHAPRPKLSDSSESKATPPSSGERKKRRGKRNKKKINVPSRLRLSTSSADSGWFSSEGCAAATAACDERLEEETETLVSSSISFSTDSSCDLNHNAQLQPIRETQPFAGNIPHHRSRRSKKRPSKRTTRAPSNPETAAAEAETPARLSMFKKLIPCTVEGKVKESYAIVKRSEDPYEDFKKSMVDMILEKQMFEAGDLEQLLQCFLSLNSRHYHGVIVQAFSEIWEAIFSPPGCSKPSVDQNRRRVSRPASF